MKKKKDWRPYQPTAYDLARDPKLASNEKPFEWKSYRDFKAQERNKDARNDIMYKDFRTGKGRFW